MRCVYVLRNNIVIYHQKFSDPKVDVHIWYHSTSIGVAPLVSYKSENARNPDWDR